jgi:DNA-binding HxlR family transcriptional regulator
VDGDDRDPAGPEAAVLVDTLRVLERDGLSRPDSGDEFPTYRFTPLGRTLREPLLALQQWAESHVDDLLLTQQAYDGRHIEDLLTDSDERWEPGW